MGLQGKRVYVAPTVNSVSDMMRSACWENLRVVKKTSTLYMY